MQIELARYTVEGCAHAKKPSLVSQQAIRKGERDKPDWMIVSNHAFRELLD